MTEGFIVMQIGDAAMDRVCDVAIAPAIESAGLVVRRVDRHNTGDLLKSEIVAFIERSEIIVADLTNERPNCYLEVGYAMGLGKKRNLILTAREDHHHGSPNYKPGNAKIHFDLEGYDILLWYPTDLEKFRNELEQRIKRRLAIVQSSATAHAGQPAPQSLVLDVDGEWLDQQRAQAVAGLKKVELAAYMEAVVTMVPKGDWRQQDLLAAVEASQVKTFGWPIGLVMDREAYRPHPTAGGVTAEVAVLPDESILDRPSYDLWCIQRTGDFYTLRTLFEDSRGNKDKIFLNTRIVQITELLMFLSRCYERLDVPQSTRVAIRVTHAGLEGRELSAVGNRHIMPGRKSAESSVSAAITTTIAELESRLVENVKSLLEPMFTLFDFFEVSDPIWDEIVNSFVEGRVT